MAAYRRAVRGADRLRTGLIAAGLDPDELTVAAGLGESAPTRHDSRTPRPAHHPTTRSSVEAPDSTIIPVNRRG
jgi:hypothetical protein